MKGYVFRPTQSLRYSVKLSEIIKLFYNRGFITSILMIALDIVGLVE